MVQLSASGEVGDFLDVDQFQPGRSAYECGYFSVATVKAMNKVGELPTQSVGQMIAEAEAWYAADHGGDNSSGNTDGMSLQQLYDLIVRVGLHYSACSLDLHEIRAWVGCGYPVIISGAETGMYDIGLGDKVPYSWTPSGNHIITITGVYSDGNVLVRDTANIGPQGVRPGPRIYDASKLVLVSATVVVPPWLPRPPDNFDPRKDNVMPAVPNGWHDDGTTLTAPNGHRVVRGFRDYILNHNWDPANVPLEEEVGLNPLEESNPSLGAGTQQVFNWTVLEWTQSRGVLVAWSGKELMWLRSDRDKLRTQIANLQAQLKTQQPAH
jgi:hypothetical protein